ncbi:hypothetical protein ANCCAN_18143 [Ancylostoma caninum]|uniref:SCP domain-containing protein n=1 Tax=Ancylostoma caninum TaxID=29170 RepID=A0A368FWW5_ANCCA|nr:hypothetical protein ANCCAN_18143 [Ancylostoma caninum]
MEKGRRAYLYTAVMIGSSHTNFVSYNCADETLTCNSLKSGTFQIDDGNVDFIQYAGQKQQYFNDFYFLQDAGIELGQIMNNKVFKWKSNAEMDLQSIGCCFNRDLKKAGCVLRFNTSQS